MMMFLNWKVKIVYANYERGGIAIQLIADGDGDDIIDGEPIATASVHLPGLKSGEVGIKDYSENEGMLDFVIENNIVHKPHRRDGITGIPICQIKKEETNAATRK